MQPIGSSQKIAKRISLSSIVFLFSSIIVLLIFLFINFPVTTFGSSMELNHEEMFENHENFFKRNMGLIPDNSISDIYIPKNINLKGLSTLNIQTYMYHHIRDYNVPSDPLGGQLSVSPTNFDKQLTDLQDKKYNAITFDDLIQFLTIRAPLPDKPILLTFDDGYDDIYTNAIPILQKHNMKGSFAIITGSVGKSGYLTWDELKEMKKLGESISSHTVSHPNLSTASDQKLIYELRESKRILDSTLNQDTRVIVYPSGKYNDHVIEIARKEGYVLGRTTEYGKSIDTKNLMAIPTQRISNSFKVS